MKTISKNELLSVLQNDELLFKFYEKPKYAKFLLENGCIHISTCESFRKSKTPDCDKMEGIVLKDISSGEFVIDNDLNYYSNNKEIFIKNDDLFYNHDYRYLDNYIFCMSINKSDTIRGYKPLTTEDLEKCLNNHGKYVFVTQLSEFVKRLIKTKGKPCALLASAPIIYSNNEKGNIFTKTTEYSHEHEYRLVFDMENKEESSLNISIGDLSNFSDLYKVK